MKKYIKCVIIKVYQYLGGCKSNMKVRFIKDKIVTESGQEIVNVQNKIEFIDECLKNVEYSLKIIQIISYTLKKLGYELEVNGYKHRKSSLFNEIENIIAHTEEYQKSKSKIIISKPKKLEADAYAYERRAKAKLAIASYQARRPRRFSNRDW